MQIIITTGHPHSDYQLVQQVLEAGGVHTARPSRREGLTPGELIESILRAHDVDLNVPSALRPKFPGKIWQDLAADLFLGNLRQDSWGWADAGASWLLDFWLQLDGQTRLVLAYSSPTATISKLLLQGGATVESLSAAVDSWIRWNTELLNCSVRHSSRCILVSSAAALRSPDTLLSNINELLGIQLSGGLNAVPGTVSHISALTSFLTSGLLEEFSEALALHNELQSAAHLPDDPSEFQASRARSAWEEHLASLAELERLRADIVRQDEHVRRSETELRAVMSSRDESSRELDEVRARLVRLQEGMATVEETEVLTRQRNMSLGKENEILFIQLRQLQEALEQATVAQQDPEQQRVEPGKRTPTGTTPVRNKGHLAEVALDMRREIDGKNWYWAEHDGRWAGPGMQGTLRLPAMGPGSYEVNLEVVDAMDPEILAGMQVTLCGVPLSLAREGKSYPALLKGVVAVEDDGSDGDWDVSFQFPSLSSPAQRGSTDSRNLAIRLRSIRVRALQSNQQSAQRTN